ncbi:hypothetical protein RIF29_03609 [Crotalaria pallida]|uniref:Uncharacterized protein n=1 Tax=Crotalaria pallida TaxID=3830 RepID=A0AAN9J053_CROPI
MAKKRGRPAKLSTPASAPSPKDNNDTNLAKGDSIPMDFSLLDDMNIDDLSPKKQEELLSLLDEIRNRIKGKEELSTDVSGQQSALKIMKLQRIKTQSAELEDF